MSENALEIRTVEELLNFDLGTVEINRTKYNVLTGYEGTGLCFWCGGELKGKLKRYCRGHMKLYYRHFDWGYASSWAKNRVDYKCQNCGKEEEHHLLAGYHNATMTNLRVHHIIPLNGASRQYTAFNLPWNLIVLCQSCHLKVHAAMSGANRPIQKTSFEEAIARGQYALPGVYK